MASHAQKWRGWLRYYDLSTDKCTLITLPVQIRVQQTDWSAIPVPQIAYQLEPPVVDIYGRDEAKITKREKMTTYSSQESNRNISRKTKINLHGEWKKKKKISAIRITAWFNMSTCQTKTQSFAINWNDWLCHRDLFANFSTITQNMWELYYIKWLERYQAYVVIEYVFYEISLKEFWMWIQYFLPKLLAFHRISCWSLLWISRIKIIWNNERQVLLVTNPSIKLHHLNTCLIFHSSLPITFFPVLLIKM